MTAVMLTLLMGGNGIVEGTLTGFPSLPPQREYRVQEGKVLIPLGATVHGDVVVSVYHMRSTIGGRLQAKVGV